MTVKRTTASFVAPLALALTMSVSALTLPGAAQAAVNEASQRFFESGKAELAKGNLAAAIIEFRNAIQRDPENVAARLELGKAQFQAGDIPSAEKELRIAHERAPSDETEVLLGEVLMRQGRLDEALKLISVDALTPAMQVRKHLTRGSVQLGLNKVDDAEASFKAAKKLDPNKIEVDYGLARVAAARTRFTEANGILDQILKTKPDFAPAWMLKGEVALASQNRNEAFYAFDRAVQLLPNNVDAYVARARANLMAGKTELAKADAQRVSQIEPNNPIGRYLAAAVAYAQGDIDKANEEYTRVADVFRTFQPAILLGALIKFRRNELNQSERLLAQYMSLDPTNIEARRVLAVVRIRSGQAQSAIDILKKLIAEYPDDISAYQYMASAYINLNDFDQAAKVYEEIMRRGNPEAARQANSALTLLGKSGNAQQSDVSVADGKLILRVLDLINNNDLTTAKNEVEGALGRSPDSQILLNLAGGVEMARKNYIGAREHFLKALKLNPEFLSAIDNLDRIDLLENRPNEIEQRLRKLVDANPKSEKLAVRLAKFMVDNARTSEAITLLNERAAAMPDSLLIAQAQVRAYFIGGDISKAAEAARRSAKLADKDAAALVFANVALRDAGAYQDALDVAEKLVAAFPDSEQALLTKAQSLVLLNRNKDAVALLDGAFAKKPESVPLARALVDLAVEMKDLPKAKTVAATLGKYNRVAEKQLTADATSRLGDNAGAIKLLEEALVVDPVSDLATDLFVLRRINGQINQALEGMGNWLKQNPNDKRGWMAYASALLELNRLPEAEAAYTRLLGIDPNNAAALNNYAWIRHELNRPDALDYAERAYRIAPGSPEIADTLGWLMVKNGKLKDGVNILRAAAGGATNNGEILYHLAYALSKTGRPDDAKNILRDIIQRLGNFPSRPEAEKLLASLK